MALLNFYAVCPLGFESLLKEELESIGAQYIKEDRAGVHFAGTPDVAMRACLYSRIASRILMAVAKKGYWDSEDIYAASRAVPWEKWFSSDQTFKISTTTRRCPLESVDFAALRVKDGICDRFRDLAGRRPDVERYHPDVRIAVFINHDMIFFYLDLVGEALFKRGWRLTHGEAPLKENLAAGLLKLTQWTPEKPLVDPFCGSGTIAIEAAHMALNMAPGLNRHFAFEKLAGFDLDLWRELQEDARAEVNLYAKCDIQASDISSLVVEKALENAERAGLGQLIRDGRLRFTQGDAREVAPSATEPGLLIANPPYGEQSTPKSASVSSMMKNVADNLKAHFAGWTAWMLTSDRSLPSEMRLKESRKIVMFNGPLECRFFRFDMVAGSNRRKNKTEETVA